MLPKTLATMQNMCKFANIKVHRTKKLKHISYQKAFDIVDHDKLLLKMPLLGFSHEVIDWYKS